LFLIPFAFLLFLPFGWIYAYYQNLTVIGDGETADFSQIRKEAWKLAKVWPKQNHLVLLILSLFVLPVFLNVEITVAQLPGLIQTLFGTETIFSMSGGHLMNSTLQAVVFGLTYLCLDPIVKTVYMLRCFYAASRQSGADLMAELRAFAPIRKAVVILIAVLLFVCAGKDARAANSTEPDAGPVVNNAEKLDQAIQREISKTEYQWRMPRKLSVNHKESWLEEFFDRIGETLRKWFQPVRRWLKNLWDWLEELLSRRDTSPGRHPMGAFAAKRSLILILIALVISLIAILAYRIWKRRKAQSKVIVAQAIAATPDLTDEATVANELPEEGWEALARSLLTQGDLRLALRAFYMANLSYLARSEMITIAKFKSNRDYLSEVRRRGLNQPEILPSFQDNVSLFENAWYGMHEVTPEILDRFAQNQQRMKFA